MPIRADHFELLIAPGNRTRDLSRPAFCYDVSNISVIFTFYVLFLSDDHGFSPMHWASKEGRTNIVDMLIGRGAKINATNMGDDTALHLAAAHGHREIVLKVTSKQGQP